MRRLGYSWVMSSSQAVLALAALAAVVAGVAVSLPEPEPEPRWKRYERRVCRSQRRRHVGGPGRADCGRTGEVKYWARPVDAGTVEREYRKGRTSITASNGFTGPARDLARDLGMRLIHRP